MGISVSVSAVAYCTAEEAHSGRSKIRHSTVSDLNFFHRPTPPLLRFFDRGLSPAPCWGGVSFRR
jgi:hypothetical protein